MARPTELARSRRNDVPTTAHEVRASRSSAAKEDREDRPTAQRRRARVRFLVGGLNEDRMGSCEHIATRAGDRSPGPGPQYTFEATRHCIDAYVGGGRHRCHGSLGDCSLTGTTRRSRRSMLAALAPLIGSSFERSSIATRPHVAWLTIRDAVDATAIHVDPQIARVDLPARRLRKSRERESPWETSHGVRVS
jgi:hypothetical protein